MTRTGIKLDLDVGDLVSNAGRARGAIAALGEAMKKAEQEGRFDDYGKLAYEKERLQSKTSGFEKNIRAFADNPQFQTQTANGTVFKIDQEYASLIKQQTDAMKRLTAEYEAAIKSGDITTAMSISPQIERQQNEFRKLVEETSPAAGRGMAGAVTGIGAMHIANAINDGFSRWAGTLDRSGVISQYRNGDIMGGRLSEQRRQANRWGGIAETGLTLLGTGTGFFLGGPGGAMLGGAAGNAAGRAINTAGQTKVGNEANKVAHAGLWQNQIDDAMSLAALMGEPSNVREVWGTASKTAARFGYSAEEGVAAMRQAAIQGLDGKAIKEITQQVFQHERAVGADRQTLTSISAMSERYGGGDALRAGWAGLQASGMKPAQYSEYLRAMQKVMEDGIKNGFVRSADQVAKNLTMLSQMTGNDPLFQGEQGAQRLMQMNSGLENSTELKTASDIMAFRAARKIAEKRNGGEPVSYVEAMKVLEEGINPEMFNEYMALTSSAEGGSREDITERMRQTFGLNYTTADKLYKAWESGNVPEEAELKALTGKQAGIPDASSKELDAAVTTAEIVNAWTQKGQGYWDQKFPELYQELDKIINGNSGGKGESSPNSLSEARANYDYAIAHGTEAEIKEASNALNKEQFRASGMSLNQSMANSRQQRLDITNQLYGYGWGKNQVEGLFNGNEKGFDKKLFEYAEQPEGTPARQAFEEFNAFSQALTNEQRKELNSSNQINEMIPDFMSDRTGELLLEAIRELTSKMDVDVTIN